MNYNLYDVGDIVQSKKKHPCGSFRWKVLRVGVDFKLECMGCGHVIMLDRQKALRHIQGRVEGDRVVRPKPDKNETNNCISTDDNSELEQ